MTVVDRPDNGQDEGHGDCFEVCQGHPTEELSPPFDVDVMVGEMHESSRLASGRAGAGEQQRELRQQVIDAMSWAETFGDGRIGQAGADALLRSYEAALLGGPQPDGEVRQHRMDADCWCQPVQHPSGAWDHQ